MRRVLTGVLAVFALASVNGFAQKSTPQWQVIKTFGKIKQNTLIPQTTLFTPNEAGKYRFTAYISTVGPSQNSAWALYFMWTDPTGVDGFQSVEAGLNSGSTFVPFGPYPFSVSPGTPVSFELTSSSPLPKDSTYTFWFTIERLQ